ncbi:MULTISPECIES: GNAT family N-acetyltransferase [Mumia]|uniref:GNAT family N-acetyltransferase n=1 Tax=Mumia TaxID=1546255 RepID=UPI001422B858|nr:MULTISPECIES: GNAT family N-acetyltransferase [unclassified Mumia]QMW66020.1 GNAT family N-acetyltransferase [Mumia sp. ZJ1417]
MEIRDLAVDDLDPALDVRSRSFGPLSGGDVDQWKTMMTRAIGAGRVLAAYDGGTVVAIARINAFGQWWGGRRVPMAGIGGVVVAPEHRGSGVGLALMEAVVGRSRSLGFTLSALYPATTAPYRRAGYELAGVRRTVDLSTDALRRLPGSSVPLRRGGAEDAKEVVRLLGAATQARGDSGPFDWEPAEVAADLADDEVLTYLADDGALQYGFAGDRFQVHAIGATSPETLHALWRLVGSGSSTQATTRVALGPTDPVFWMLADNEIAAAASQWWMLRLVDAAAAVAERGFPVGLTVEVPLTLSDPLDAAGSGTFVLAVSGGRGVLRRSDGPGGIALGPRGAAALFAGTPVSTLRASGLAEDGDPSNDALLDAAFAATPFMTDYF